MFIAANRGKRSIVLDLKRSDRVAVVRELARRADVLVENFRPGAMARLGLDRATLARRQPAAGVCLDHRLRRRPGPMPTGASTTR